MLRRGGKCFRHRETDRDKQANRVHHPVLSQRCPVPIDERKWNDIPAERHQRILVLEGLEDQRSDGLEFPVDYVVRRFRKRKC